MKRPVVKFSELFRVKHGYAFKSQFFDSSGPYVLLTPGSFHEEGGYREQEEKTKFYTGDVPDGFTLEEGDLLIAMTEQAPGLLGSSAWIPESNRYLHNQRLGRIVDVDERRLNRRFLYYLFNTREVRHQISGSASGTKVRHTAPERIGRVEVNLPPVQTQCTIAEILTSYDDLMENNRRRILLLEAAARMIYSEWFVLLRFPGYEHTRTANGMPVGWKKAQIGEIFTTILGGTPSRARAEYWDGGIVPWINSGKVNELRVIEPSEFITEEALKNSAAKLMPKGTTILAITGATLGQVSMLEIQCAANQSVVGVIDASNLYDEWIYLTFKERIHELVNRATGGAQVHINKDIVNAFEVVLPSKPTAELFKEYVEPMFRQIAVLLFQNRKLCSARDLLLPRLMNGEILV